MLLFSLLVITISIISGFIILWKIPEPGKKDENSSDQAREKAAESCAKISIIIPARNEENRIPALLKTLKDQANQPFEIIVVDDQSDDKTAQIAANAGAKVISTSRLDDSWIGKSYACWTGAQEAKGDWLMFLDADTRLEDNQSLSKIASAYNDMNGSGILSLQPYHHVTKFYESLSAIFNVIVLAGMNVFTPWKNKFKSAGSFGPCIICSKKDYFQIEGHKAVSSAVMDDLALGELFRKSGFQVECYAGRGLINFQMYPEGFRQLFEGWTKSFGTASQSTHPFVFALIIAWISGGYSTTALLIRSITSGSDFWIGSAIIAYLMYMFQFIFQTRRVGNFNLILLVFYPFLHLFFTILFIWSLFRTKVLHSVNWRGRKIKV